MYLACELSRTVGFGVAMSVGTHLSGVGGMLLFLPGAMGAWAIDARAKRLAERREGRRLLFVNPLSDSWIRARGVFASVATWEEAFQWLGIDPEKAATARYVTFWIMGILLATGMIPVLVRQTA